MSEVYFDVSDIYYKVKKVFNKKVNYKLLIGVLSEKFGDVTRGEAYGCQSGNEAQGFITHLRSADIIVYYRRPKTFHVNEQEIKTCNWNVDITISALCSESKTLIFCSSNPDLIPLYKHLQIMGKKVIVVGCGVPSSIKSIVDVCENIPESVLK